MAEPGVAERLTGYVVGGISPFGQRRRLPVVVDSTAQQHESVYVSGGRRGLQIEVSPGALIDVPHRLAGSDPEVRAVRRKATAPRLSSGSL